MLEVGKGQCLILAVRCRVQAQTGVSLCKSAKPAFVIM